MAILTTGRNNCSRSRTWKKTNKLLNTVISCFVQGGLKITLVFTINLNFSWYVKRCHISLRIRQFGNHVIMFKYLTPSYGRFLLRPWQKEINSVNLRSLGRPGTKWHPTKVRSGHISQNSMAVDPTGVT